jgi:hypothetical protein
MFQKGRPSRSHPCRLASLRERAEARTLRALSDHDWEAPHQFAASRNYLPCRRAMCGNVSEGGSFPSTCNFPAAVLGV